MTPLILISAGIAILALFFFVHSFLEKRADKNMEKNRVNNEIAKKIAREKKTVHEIRTTPP